MNQQQNCRSEDLTLYAYGELDNDERCRLEQHLESCPECQQELASLKAFVNGVGQSPVIDERQLRQLEGRVLEQVGQRRQHLAWGGLALGSGLVAVLAFLLMQSSVTPPHQAVSPAPLMTQLEIFEKLEMLEELELLEELDLLVEIEDLG